MFLSLEVCNVKKNEILKNWTFKKICTNLTNNQFRSVLERNHFKHFQAALSTALCLLRCSQVRNQILKESKINLKKFKFFISYETRLSWKFASYKMRDFVTILHVFIFRSFLLYFIYYFESWFFSTTHI